MPSFCRLLAFIGALACLAAGVFGGSGARAQCVDVACSEDGGAPGRSVRVGYTQFAPYSETALSGIAEGFSIDLYRMLLEPSGYTIAFVAFDNPQEMIAALGRHEIDATTLLAINPERSEAGAFTNVIRTISIGLVTDVDGPRIATVEDLAGLRIGVSSGSAPESLVTDKGAFIARFDSSNELVLPLLTGDVDAVAAVPDALFRMARKAGVEDRLRSSELVLRELPSAFLVSRGRPDLRAVIDDRLANAVATGEMTRLETLWFSGSAPRQVYLLVALIAGVTVLGGLALLAARDVGRRRNVALGRPETAPARLLENALNTVDALILVTDRDMRVIWWNDAYARKRPWQRSVLRTGAPLVQLIAASMRAGMTDYDGPAEEAERLAQEQVEDIRRGYDLVRTDVMIDGRVYIRRCSQLPTGEFAIVATDVTELARTNSELKAATGNLRDANEKLSDFARIAAHDLKAPLRNIQLLNKFIREDLVGLDVSLGDEIAEHFQSVEQISERLGKMVDDLLSYSAPEGDYSASAFDPREEVLAVLNMLGLPNSFRVEIPPEMPEVYADPTAFQIVVRNLLSNAVKHHDRSTGRIDVTCSVHRSDCVIDVADDGPGIPEAYRDRVFEPLKTLKSRDEGAGTGLGLSFVQRTVNGWGGRVIILGNEPGRGSRFRFTIPLAAPRDNVIQLAGNC